MSVSTTANNPSLLTQESEAYKNFINSIDSEVTKKSYRYGLSLFMKYCNLEDYDYDSTLALQSSYKYLELGSELLV